MVMDEAAVELLSLGTNAVDNRVYVILNVAMESLTQVKYEMMEMSLMAMDETAHEQLNQIMSEVGLRVHVLCFVETALSILVKHEMMEI